MNWVSGRVIFRGVTKLYLLTFCTLGKLACVTLVENNCRLNIAAISTGILQMCFPATETMWTSCFSDFLCVLVLQSALFKISLVRTSPLIESTITPVRKFESSGTLQQQTISKCLQPVDPQFAFPWLCQFSQIWDQVVL